MKLVAFDFDSTLNVSDDRISDALGMQGTTESI